MREKILLNSHPAARGNPVLRVAGRQSGQPEGFHRFNPDTWYKQLPRLHFKVPLNADNLRVHLQAICRLSARANNIRYSHHFESESEVVQFLVAFEAPRLQWIAMETEGDWDGISDVSLLHPPPYISEADQTS